MVRWLRPSQPLALACPALGLRNGRRRADRSFEAQVERQRQGLAGYCTVPTACRARQGPCIMLSAFRPHPSWGTLHRYQRSLNMLDMCSAEQGIDSVQRCLAKLLQPRPADRPSGSMPAVERAIRRLPRPGNPPSAAAATASSCPACRPAAAQWRPPGHRTGCAGLAAAAPGPAAAQLKPPGQHCNALAAAAPGPAAAQLKPPGQHCNVLAAAPVGAPPGAPPGHTAAVQLAAPGQRPGEQLAVEACEGPPPGGRAHHAVASQQALPEPQPACASGVRTTAALEKAPAARVLPPGSAQLRPCAGQHASCPAHCAAEMQQLL